MNRLRKHQLTMYEMLIEVDRICKKYEIKYMLFAGTMLGAVRHKGFIPWDDDLDIIMLRPDYEKFLKVASVELNDQEYFLQKEFSEHWPMFFSKLRKHGTTCIERYIPKDTHTHLGVYIDIFPCDNLSNHFMKRRIQFFASKIMIAHALGQRGYLTKNPLKKIFLIGCKRIPAKLLNAVVRNKEEKQSKEVHSFFGGASKYKKNIFERKWLEETVDMQFERREFPISAYYTEMLTRIYGDYMTPTPKGKRAQKIHGEIIDLSNSYEKYEGIQNQLIYKEYTRSIR